MTDLGIYYERKVVWIGFKELLEGKMPTTEWVCLATSSDSKPDIKILDRFIRTAIQNNIIEFKGHGTYGELMHDVFDETVVEMEVLENYPPTDIMTTWHNGEALASVFWQSFFTSGNYNEYDNILTVVVTSLDHHNLEEELLDYISRFEKGWIPED